MVTVQPRLEEPIKALDPAAHSSVGSVSGKSSITFGGAYTRHSAAYSSVNSVSGNSSTTFGGAYARPPAAYSPVITRPPWHNSNPFVDYLSCRETCRERRKL